MQWGDPLKLPGYCRALAGEEIKPGKFRRHRRRAASRAALDLKLIDKVVENTNEEAISTARRLMEEEGILAGISSGAAVLQQLQEDESFTNKGVFVVILPSSGEALSRAPRLFADLFY